MRSAVMCEVRIRGEGRGDENRLLKPKGKVLYDK